MSKKYLIGVFIGIAITIFLAIGSLSNAYNNFMSLNPMYRGEITSVGINSDLIPGEKCIELFSKDKNISASIEHIGVDVSYGQAIYFNELKGKIKISEGRFLEKKDFQNGNNKYIVIGKNMKKHIIDEKYINVNGQKFEVIGVLGIANKDSVYDNTFYINLNGYMDTLHNEEVEMYINSSSVDVIDAMRDEFKDISIYENVESKNLFFKVMGDSKAGMASFGFMCVLFFLNIVNITTYYARYKLKEIGVKRSYGGNNWSIFKCIFQEYISLATVGFLFALIVYFVLSKMSALSPFMGESIGLASIIFAYLIIVILGGIVSFISFTKTNKYKICELLKGR